MLLLLRWGLSTRGARLPMGTAIWVSMGRQWFCRHRPRHIAQVVLSALVTVSGSMTYKRWRLSVESGLNTLASRACGWLMCGRTPLEAEAVVVGAALAGCPLSCRLGEFNCLLTSAVRQRIVRVFLRLWRTQTHFLRRCCLDREAVGPC